MTDKNETPVKRKFTPDWFVRGVLTRIGETFDRFTGRNWKPSSSLATSELIERLKKLLDAEARDDGRGGRFVPHNIKLKTQWDKFSTDAEDAMRKLKNELLTAAIDHINDNRYHTYAPLKVDIKPDYFTEGVKLQASFDEFAPEDEPRAAPAEINVTVPQMKVGDFVPSATADKNEEEETENFVAEYIVNGKQKSTELRFTRGKRLSVGRTKENDLIIDDVSISKHHATLMVNSQDKFLVADTGSTNGTFINGERIAYGRAFDVTENDRLKFGSVEVFFRRIPKATTFVQEEAAEDNDPQKTIAFEKNGNGSQADGSREMSTAESHQSIKQTVETLSTGDYPKSNAMSENPVTEQRRETQESAIAPATEPGIKFDFGDNNGGVSRKP